MLSYEELHRGLRRYRNLTALGYRYKNKHDYWNAKMAFEESIIPIGQMLRDEGDRRDMRDFDRNNVKLNRESLKKIHLSYKLSVLFANSGHWRNTYPQKKLLSEYVAKKPIKKALISYYSVNFQNLLLNADIKFRKRYGCLGLTAINDYRLERRHMIHRKEMTNWLDRMVDDVNRLKRP